MSTIVMDKKDELIMKLVHYFITKENYNPIVVNGVKDEIWLENTEGPYRIIRINSKNIFNKEQLNYDYLKIDSVVRQVKKKTLSFRVNTLNILLNVNEDLKVEGTKNIEPVTIYNNDCVIKDKALLEAFPNINEELLNDTNGVELIINVTKDINEKTERENRVFENTFKSKKIVITPLIIFLCVVAFIATVVIGGTGALASVDPNLSVRLGGNISSYVRNGEIWRLVSYMFLHASLIHLLVNMYSLYIIGTQMETFIGKGKFVVLYFVSGICGGLLSSVMLDSNIVAVGASGAIFGLLGALLYFGFYYRAYLGSALLSQIIPIIVINLGIGMMPGIDNACHIGGLLGGAFCMMALGVDGKSKKMDRINGTVCLLLLIGVLSYLAFFK